MLDTLSEQNYRYPKLNSRQVNSVAIGIHQMGHPTDGFLGKNIV